jgi:hypothetical protein
MARRSTNTIPDDDIDLSDPFAGMSDDEGYDDVRTGSRRKQSKPARLPKARRRRKKGRGLFGCLGALIASLILALLILPLFLVAGGLAAFGLEIAGVDIPDDVVSLIGSAAPEATAAPDSPDAPNDPSPVGENNPPAAQADPGSAEAQPPTSAPLAVDTQGCVQGAVWWASQQQNFNDLLVGGIDGLYLRTVDNVALVVQPLREKRNFSANQIATPPCYISARNQLIRGMDSVIAALETNNRPAYSSALSEFSVTLTLMWDQGVWTSPDSAAALGVPRGGGADCVPQPWLESVRRDWDTITQTVDTVDLARGTPLALRATLDQVQASRGNLNFVTPEGCTVVLHRYLTTAIDDAIAGVQAALLGDFETARARFSGYLNNTVMLNAWLLWYGVEPL